MTANPPFDGRLFDHVPLALFRAAADGTIVEGNRALARLLGLPDPRALEGRRAQEFYVDPTERAAWVEVACREGLVERFAVRLRHTDGSVVEGSLSARTVASPDGSVQLLEGSIEDATETLGVRRALREAEDQLRSAQRLEDMGRLATGIAHDFNNVLTIVLGHAEIAREALGPQHPSARDLDSVVAAAEKGAALTRRLLETGRARSAQRSATDVGAAVRELATLLGRTLGGDVRLQVVVAPDVGRVWADPSDVDQVVLNLCVNAREAMPRGGGLHVRVEEAIPRPPRAAIPHVRITVADEGTGMSPEVVARAFEPRFTTKDPERSSGLGLSVARRIAEELCGWIDVQSEPGKGTTFHVWLPLHDPPPAPRPAARTDVGRTDAGRGDRRGSERLLVVEDDAAVRSMMVEALGRHGYRVEAAGSFDDVARVLSDGRADIALVVADVTLPGPDGLHVVDRLRSRDAALRVLLTSGLAGESPALATVRARGLALLRKPFTPRDLVRAVRHELDAPG